jgi:hypothetical protein
VTGCDDDRTLRKIDLYKKDFFLPSGFAALSRSDNADAGRESLEVAAVQREE